ncbi:S9 family peptidase [Aliidiomarina celeris]|uniref:S9 family peptidase n=1 Tax=Aliidiomarina celeris TaxID=2249428 RepID=UPI000DE99FB2|nr:S9 family peptidase [Aliidiomarina celeris]
MARLWVWLGAAMLAMSSAYAQDVTLEHIVTTQSVNQVITTSDGKHTAFTRVRPRDPFTEADGSSYIELFMRDAEGNETPFVTGDLRIGQIAFSADNKHLYYLARRGDDKHTSLYSIPVSGGESTRVLQHDTAISSFSVSDDGKWIAFRASDKGPEKQTELNKAGFRAKVFEEELRMVRVHLLNLENNEVSAVPFDEYVVSAQFRPNSTQLLVKAAPTPFIDDTMMLSSFVLINTDGSEVTRFESEGKLGDAVFSADGSRLAFIGAQDKHDPATGRIFLANLRNGSVEKLLPGFAGHFKDMVWKDNNTLIWLADIGTETTIVSHNLRRDRQTALVPTGRVIAMRFGNMASDGTLTLIANSPAHPNEAFSLKGDRLTRLTDSNAWLHDARQPRQEVIRHTARDGLELEGILVYPHDYREGQRVPVIMAIHGGPEAHIRNGWNDRYSTPTWFTAQHGFATFYPNYRGSTGRGVEFSKLGQNDYAGKEFDDIVDAKEHLVEIGLADPDRVGITGGSYGGYASAWGATKQTEHFAASVMFVGISNNLSKFGTTDIPNEMHLVHARSYPWDKWQWYLERSPIYWAEQGRTPILIMHGEEDTRVHPSQSMELYRYLKVHGNVPVRLVLYPGEGHGNSRAASQLDYAYRMFRWMNWYLVDQKEGIPPHELDFAERL